jgi:hypothetical protein
MARGSSRQPNLKFPSAKTLQEYNPAALLLDKHKKLKLTDAQQEHLKALRLQIFERNANLLARYDSVQREYQPPQATAPRAGGGFGGGGRGRGGPPEPAADSIRREAMRPMIRLRQLADSLEERRRTDVRDVLGVLTDAAQRKRAAEYLDKQDIEFSKQFPALPQPRDGRAARPSTAA